MLYAALKLALSGVEGSKGVIRNDHYAKLDPAQVSVLYFVPASADPWKSGHSWPRQALLQVMPKGGEQRGTAGYPVEERPFMAASSEIRIAPLGAE